MVSELMVKYIFGLLLVKCKRMFQSKNIQEIQTCAILVWLKKNTKEISNYNY